MIYTYKLHSFLRLWQSSENQLGQCLFNNLFGKERAMRCYNQYYTCARYACCTSATVPSNHSRSSQEKEQSPPFLCCSLSLLNILPESVTELRQAVTDKCGKRRSSQSLFMYGPCTPLGLVFGCIDIVENWLSFFGLFCIGKAVMDKMAKQILAAQGDYIQLWKNVK